MIAPDDKALSYSGRTDFEDPMAPEFINPCSSITARFTGTGIKALVSNRHGCWDNYLGAVIDGQEYKYLLENTGEKQYITLAEGLPDRGIWGQRIRRRSIGSSGLQPGS